MKKVTLLTATPFWRQGTGVWARTATLVRYLSAHCELTIIATCAIQPGVLQRLRDAATHCRFIAADDGGAVNETPPLESVRDICARLGPADVYIIDKLEHTALLDILPAGGQRFVDTHDLLSQKTLSMQRYGYQPRIRMSVRRERELLALYDGVICIQREDHALVGDWLGVRKAILAPHPVAITPHAVRQDVDSIGFAASDWLPNIDGLQWFLRDVWPAFTERGVSLDVYGSIGERFDACDTPGVRFHGHTNTVADIYSRIDMLINPVRFGSGLKIKTVEALANGRPLVTTSEGARGLADAHGSALLIADDATSFIDALDTLLNSRALRQQIAAGALAYAREYFSPEACFGELIARINAA